MTEPEMLPAFVLHTRPYRETSQLVDLFVASMGKVSMVAKGSRTSRSAVKGLLQPFLPLHIRYSGKSNLKTLVQLEARSPQVALQGERLFSALYLMNCFIISWNQIRNTRGFIVVIFRHYWF